MEPSFFDGGMPQANVRSGEAARLAQMPVARLRLWERRYEVVGPQKTKTGQRLYSENDIRRLALINGLVNRGHAIGAIARLECKQLELLNARNAQTTQSKPASAPSALSFRLIVVGENLERRLSDTSSAVAPHGIGESCAYPDMATARQDAATTGGKVNILLVRVPSLHDEHAAEVLALGDVYRAGAMAVVYGFGKDSAAESLRHAGVRLYREPDSRSEMRQMLSDLCRTAAIAHHDGGAIPWSRAARRYDDEALEGIAASSSAIACECPRHLVEIVAQLSAFEAYSDECTSRSAQDEALHRFLGDTANRARTLIESALARVVREEGLLAQPRERD
jgi:DNA-binding transcriptional MerR regulator